MDRSALTRRDSEEGPLALADSLSQQVTAGVAPSPPRLLGHPGGTFSVVSTPASVIIRTPRAPLFGAHLLQSSEFRARRFRRRGDMSWDARATCSPATSQKSRHARNAHVQRSRLNAGIFAIFFGHEFPARLSRRRNPDGLTSRCSWALARGSAAGNRSCPALGRDAGTSVHRRNRRCRAR